MDRIRRILRSREVEESDDEFEGFPQTTSPHNFLTELGCGSRTKEQEVQGPVDRAGIFCRETDSCLILCLFKMNKSIQKDAASATQVSLILLVDIVTRRNAAVGSEGLAWQSDVF